MPTTNPRVSITLDPADLAVIDRFAAALGQPRATVLAGLVASVAPELAKAAHLVELANAAPRKVQEDLARGLEAATEDALGSLQRADDAFQQAMSMLNDKPKARAGAGRKAGAGTAPARSGPPPTNRGVKFPRKGGGK